MLRLSSGSCMLRLGLRLSIGSCMLRLRLRLSIGYACSGSGSAQTQIILTRHADILTFGMDIQH